LRDTLDRAMNQGIAFSRTLRALDADDFRASKLGLWLAALLLAAWAWWMLSARVPQYETTSNIRIESGRVVAYFPAGAMSRISMGQPALARYNDSELATRVEAIASDHARLALPPNPQSRIPTSIEIEVSRLSPAAIALRTLR
jgi:hypothetical protein